MDPMQKAIMQGMLSTERSAARAEVLEGVIADFFRLYLATEGSTLEEVRAGLGMLSEKLLAQQAEAMQAKEASMQAIQDAKAAQVEQRRQLEAAAAEDQRRLAEAIGEPQLAAVPDPPPQEEPGE